MGKKKNWFQNSKLEQEASVNQRVSDKRSSAGPILMAQYHTFLQANLVSFPNLNVQYRLLVPSHIVIQVSNLINTLIFFPILYNKLYKLYFQNTPNLTTSQSLVHFPCSCLTLTPSTLSPLSTKQSDG